jgi:hypothetical protein
VDYEVDIWIRNATSAETAPQAPSGIRNGGAAPEEKRDRPRGATVEEVKDEDDASHLPSPHQAVDATDSLFKYPRTPNHNEGVPIDAKCGNPAGEVATSSLPALEARESQPLPFPMPKDFPRVNEKVVLDGSPSVYLQRRCPVCFSGRKPELKTSAYVPGIPDFTTLLTHICTSAQVIVCIDANFAQRRRHSRCSDPVDPHVDTHFLPAHEVETMRRAVERERYSEAHSGPGARVSLPDHTLDDCEKVFIAAQGHIAKASSNIFADTGLMALVCHHDRPLFLVNMTSAGERQYYALALIKALYDHLPGDWVVGLLYDVACQLERSIRKVSPSFVTVVSRLNWNIARLLARVRRPTDVRSISISCLWSPVGVSTGIPPPEVQRLWSVRWRGL